MNVNDKYEGFMAEKRAIIPPGRIPDGRNIGNHQQQFARNPLETAPFLAACTYPGAVVQLVAGSGLTDPAPAIPVSGKVPGAGIVPGLGIAPAGRGAGARD